LRRRIAERAHLAETSHAIALHARPHDFGVLPETKRSMLFEGRQAAQDLASIEEAGRSPLEGFLDLRTGSMHAFAQALQNRLRERGCLGDVRVNARIGRFHAAIEYRL
jgi:hypothetical protein